jgi:hypothetical protein
MNNVTKNCRLLPSCLIFRTMRILQV